MIGNAVGIQTDANYSLDFPERFFGSVREHGEGEGGGVKDLC